MQLNAALSKLRHGAAASLEAMANIARRFALVQAFVAKVWNAQSRIMTHVSSSLRRDRRLVRQATRKAVRRWPQSAAALKQQEESILRLMDHSWVETAETVVKEQEHVLKWAMSQASAAKSRT